jgi:hypothetical protein
MQKRVNPIIMASQKYMRVRIVLGVLASMSFLSSKAQIYLPGYNMNFIQWTPFPSYDQIRAGNHINQKWYFTKYADVSAGVGFFNGGSATVISTPIGLQLNRKLNNNLVAFAGVYAAPTFFNFGRSFTDPSFNKSYPGSNFSNQYGFGINHGFQMGLMYVNDARTFSISGSIGVEQSSYPVYPTERRNSKK